MNQAEELEYLMNPVLYDKYLHVSSKERNVEFLENKKFYRKRIQQMAKDCSKFGIIKGASEPPTPLLNAFDNFAKQCIQHFRLIDEAECYQDEYNDIVQNNANNTNNANNANNANNIENLDVEFLAQKTQTHKVISMDDFVTKTNTKQKAKIHLPKHKVANVKDDKYRTKGIKKNKSKQGKNNKSKQDIDK